MAKEIAITAHEGRVDVIWGDTAYIDRIGMLTVALEIAMTEVRDSVRHAIDDGKVIDKPQAEGEA